MTARHGGSCCGMAHIYGLADPDLKLSAIPESTCKDYEYIRWYYGKRPAETTLERFKVMLQDIIDNRSAGCVEAILAEDLYTSKDGHTTRYKVWKPILEEHGFKEVASFWNSNSDNKCHVFHLYTGQEEYAGAAEEDEHFDTNCCDDSCGEPGCCCDCESEF